MRASLALSTLVFYFGTGALAHAVLVRDLRVGSIVMFSKPTWALSTNCEDLSGVRYFACRGGRMGVLPEILIPARTQGTVTRIRPVVKPGALAAARGYNVYFDVSECRHSCGRVIQAVRPKSVFDAKTADDDAVELDGAEVLAY